GRGPGRIHRAAPLLGVEEAADAAEVLILLAAHRVLVAPTLDRELLLRLLEAQVEVLRQPLHVALGERDQRIRAAVAGTFAAVIHAFLSLSAHGRPRQWSVWRGHPIHHHG